MSRHIILAFFCLLCASLARGYLDKSVVFGEFKDLIDQVTSTCIEKTEASLDLILNTNEGVFPEDDKLKCYMKCVLTEGGAMDEAGQLDFSAVEEILPEKIRGFVDAMFAKCLPAATHEDLCQRSFEFFKCCYDADAENYFLL